MGYCNSKVPGTLAILQTENWIMAITILVYVLLVCLIYNILKLEDDKYLSIYLGYFDNYSYNSVGNIIVLASVLYNALIVNAWFVANNFVLGRPILEVLVNTIIVVFLTKGLYAYMDPYYKSEIIMKQLRNKSGKRF